jgi:hypothetical protein
VKSLFSYTLIFITLASCAGSQAYQPQKNHTDSQVTSSKYHRKEWRHWTDENRNCLNTRNEILKERSASQITLNKKGCKVVSGSWDDYYYPEKLHQARQVDIDHLIPLKNAHISGGANWTLEKKKEFANDPENLVITNKRYNRSKGSKGIDSWLPVDKSYACKYVHDWIKIKTKYQLQFSEKELFTIKTIKPTCGELGMNL